MTRWTWVVAAAAVCGFLAPIEAARGDVRLPKVLTAGVVLQQDHPIRVWGWADAGESVSVAFNGKTAEAKAGEDGRWRVELPAMSADNKPHTLTVRGKNTVALADVMLGEVWLAVGQSNMSRGLRFVKDRAKSEPMDYPNLRLFFVGLDQVPQREEPALTRGWAPATHETMNKVFVHPQAGPYEFSEVTYQFGRAIHEKLGVPVGMISAAFPGSTCAEWTPAEKPEEQFDFAPGKNVRAPGSMYQSMIHGLPPFAIRGAIYYQGENDAQNERYLEDMERMLAGWRARFERRDLPLYMAQIAQTTFNGGMLRVHEAQQRFTERVPHTAVASSNDLWDGGDATKAKARKDQGTGWPVVAGGDPHPPNKHVIAARLARVALAERFGMRDIGEPRGPMVASHEVRGGTVVVKFRHAGKGLRTDDGEAPNWFQVAGEDGKFVNAEAKIVGPDTVELKASGVDQPRHFRFAWHTLARHNLYNSDGVPAINYRSDGPPAPPPAELLRPATAPAAKAEPSVPASRTARTIEGWTVRVDDRLLDGPDQELGTRALRFLEAKLVEIKIVVPAERVKQLQSIPIVLDLTCGKLGPMQYHPSAGWLKDNGHSPDLARCVHLPRAADVATRRNVNEQPWVILHELAHGYHDQVLGFEEPRILEAYKRFKESGRGEKAMLYDGKRTRHYGLSNHKEFFAEMTESFFGVNDFYPFNRAELKEAEPELYELLSQIWK